MNVAKIFLILQLRENSPHSLLCLICSVVWRCSVKKVLLRILQNSRNIFNPIQDGGGKKPPLPPTSFSPVTSTNVGFGPQNFLTFSFNPFATLVQNFKFVPSVSPKLLNLNQDHPSKKTIFLVKSL